jgi:RND superfamily putative drug exporter
VAGRHPRPRPLAHKLSCAQSNDAITRLPESAESTQVLRVSKEFRPETFPAVVIYARDSGLTAADRKTISEDIARPKRLGNDGIRGMEARGPFYDRPSQPRTVLVHLPVSVSAEGGERLATAVDSIRETVGDDKVPVYVTGPAGISALAFRYLFGYAGEDTAFPLFVSWSP